MRNVISAINITLGGCCDHTKTIADEELLEYYAHLLRDVDLLVLGRKTYQLMVPYRPDVAKSRSETKAEIEFAQTFVSKNKIVFSQSLESAEDKNTKIVRTKLRDEILKLKQEQGKSILAGGVDIKSLSFQLLFQLPDPVLQELALGFLLGQGQGLLIGRPGLGGPAEPAVHIGLG
jgi:dihydrofolate reductase